MVYGASDLVSLSDESFDVTATWANYTTSKLSSVEYSIDNWNGGYWGSEYVKGGNIDWGILNTTNVSNSKIYITVDNHNGIAWITFFWQYYTDSGRTTLIDGNNTVFVNYGRLPITAGESIYIIPASEFSAVSFIK